MRTNITFFSTSRLWPKRRKTRFFRTFTSKPGTPENSQNHPHEMNPQLTAKQPRVEVVDALRGFAVMGDSAGPQRRALQLLHLPHRPARLARLVGPQRLLRCLRPDGRQILRHLRPALRVHVLRAMEQPAAAGTRLRVPIPLAAAPARGLRIAQLGILHGWRRAAALRRRRHHSLPGAQLQRQGAAGDWLCSSCCSPSSGSTTRPGPSTPPTGPPIWAWRTLRRATHTRNREISSISCATTPDGTKGQPLLGHRRRALHPDGRTLPPGLLLRPPAALPGRRAQHTAVVRAARLPAPCSTPRSTSSRNW